MGIYIRECSSEAIQKVIFEVLEDGGDTESAKQIVRDTFNINDESTLEKLIRSALNLGRLGSYPSTW